MNKLWHAHFSTRVWGLFSSSENDWVVRNVFCPDKHNLLVKHDNVASRKAMRCLYIRICSPCQQLLSMYYLLFTQISCFHPCLVCINLFNNDLGWQPRLIILDTSILVESVATKVWENRPVIGPFYVRKHSTQRFHLLEKEGWRTFAHHWREETDLPETRLEPSTVGLEVQSPNSNDEAYSSLPGVVPLS